MAVGRGPVNRYYEGSVAPVRKAPQPGKKTAAVAKHDHQFRAVAKGLDPLNGFIVLSACAVCSATKVDDINPDLKASRELQKARVERYRKTKSAPRVAAARRQKEASA